MRNEIDNMGEKIKTEKIRNNLVVSGIDPNSIKEIINSMLKTEIILKINIGKAYKIDQKLPSGVTFDNDI